MLPAAEQPPESVPPQKRASGAEIAPLVPHDGAAAEADRAAWLAGLRVGSVIFCEHTGRVGVIWALIAYVGHPTRGLRYREYWEDNHFDGNIRHRSAIVDLGRIRRPSAEEAARATVWEAERAEREAEEARRRRRSERKKSCKKQAKVAFPLGAACGLLVLLIGYFNGCGACENDAACDRLFGECV